MTLHLFLTDFIQCRLGIKWAWSKLGECRLKWVLSSNCVRNSTLFTHKSFYCTQVLFPLTQSAENLTLGAFTQRLPRSFFKRPLFSILYVWIYLCSSSLPGRWLTWMDLWKLLALQLYCIIKHIAVCAYFFPPQTESLSVSQSSENDTPDIQVMYTFLSVMTKWLFSDRGDLLHLFWSLIFTSMCVFYSLGCRALKTQPPVK